MPGARGRVLSAGPGRCTSRLHMGIWHFAGLCSTLSAHNLLLHACGRCMAQGGAKGRVECVNPVHVFGVR